MMKMNGLIGLVGSGEYLPVMEEVDRFLLANCGAGSQTPHVICLPTAAGQEGEGSWGDWMRRGEEHFRRLGAQVSALPIIDRDSADDPQYVEALEKADLVYFSGGNPHYLLETLNGSLAWAAAEKAWERGAVYAGCSAGAMILGVAIPNFRRATLANLPAFGVLPIKMILPHFDRWKLLRGAMLKPMQHRLVDGEYLLGIDEETALVGRQTDVQWRVMGKGTVSMITKNELKSFRSGEAVLL